MLLRASATSPPEGVVMVELSWRCSSSLRLRNTQSFEKAKPLWRLERVREKERERVLNSENVNTNTAACAVRASNVALPIPVRFSLGNLG